jgi:hypothetical protein
MSFLTHFLPCSAVLGESGQTVNTVLLSHFDGSDASTSLTDSSLYNRTMTANGNAQLDTAQNKFGASSLLLDGVGDYVSIPNSSDFQFDTNDFTIEAFVRFSSLSGTQNIMAWSDASGARQFYWDGGLSKFRIWSAPSHVLEGDVVSLSIGTWYHIAFVRYSGTFYVYIDGINRGQNTISRSMPLPNHANGVGIGCEVTAPSQFLAGWIDEIRVVKGTAVYIGGFTPPSAPHS